jgi:hypothetical protein
MTGGELEAGHTSPPFGDEAADMTVWSRCAQA